MRPWAIGTGLLTGSKMLATLLPKMLATLLPKMLGTLLPKMLGTLLPKMLGTLLLTILVTTGALGSRPHVRPHFHRK